MNCSYTYTYYFFEGYEIPYKTFWYEIELFYEFDEICMN